MSRRAVFLEYELGDHVTFEHERFGPLTGYITALPPAVDPGYVMVRHPRGQTLVHVRNLGNVLRVREPEHTRRQRAPQSHMRKSTRHRRLARRYEQIDPERAAYHRRIADQTGEPMLERVWMHRIPDDPEELLHQGRHAHTRGAGVHVRLRPYMTDRERRIARLYLSKPARMGRHQYHEFRHAWSALKSPETPWHRKAEIALSALGGLATFVSPIPGDELIGAALIHHALHVAQGKPRVPFRRHLEHAAAALYPMHAPRLYEAGWIAKVKTSSTHPPPGTFQKSGEEIARIMSRRSVSPGGPGSAIRMVEFFMNRAGHRLPPERRRELKKAIAILRRRAAR